MAQTQEKRDSIAKRVVSGGQQGGLPSTGADGVGRVVLKPQAYCLRLEGFLPRKDHIFDKTPEKLDIYRAMSKLAQTEGRRAWPNKKIHMLGVKYVAEKIHSNSLIDGAPRKWDGRLYRSA